MSKSSDIRGYDSAEVIKLIDLNKHNPDHIGCADGVVCVTVTCDGCPMVGAHTRTGATKTLGDLRKLDPRVPRKTLDEAFAGTTFVYNPGDNVKYIGPAGNLSGLYGVVKEVNATNSQVFVDFGDTNLLNVWLNTALVIKHHGPLPVKPKVSGGTEDPSVKRPSHYQVFDGLESIEVIARSMTVSEFRGFCMGNVLKYRLRAGKKSDQANVTKDLAKAEFYKELFEKHKGQCYAAK